MSVPSCGWCLRPLLNPDSLPRNAELRQSSQHVFHERPWTADKTERLAMVNEWSEIRAAEAPVRTGPVSGRNLTRDGLLQLDPLGPGEFAQLTLVGELAQGARAV